jgi:pimeloyl-ACP methyl ester carboxylesterase
MGTMRLGLGLAAGILGIIGGGFDQAIAAAGRLIAAGYQVVAPSRFGFLRSASPNDHSPSNQADAFAVLLDELHIQRVPVVGISLGALSALQRIVRSDFAHQ